ncbi:MAG: effector binding domain-containing protein [Chloroflexi bacterium]|nr:effector binding domain-containing protein [Chloroflexota bacterium]MCC6897041.1 effector binding domain-containing protein [Anaerolineae bacterium]
MSHFTPTIGPREGFSMVGLSIRTTVQANIEHGAIKRLEATFFKRSIDIPNRIGTAKILLQIYPSGGFFNDRTTYTCILGCIVENLDTLPEGMVGYPVPAGRYAKVTHVGSEVWINRTYSFIYRHWLPRKQRIHPPFSYEVWDRRYLPGQAQSEIDIYIPLAESYEKPARRRYT